MLNWRAGKFIIGKAAYGFACIAATVTIVVSGLSHSLVSKAGALGLGVTIPGSSSVGEMNILVMGLESRTDYEGNVLSPKLLKAMHAGKYSSIADGQISSQDTNTLILIHIFAGGQRAVGYSIPRDDLVTYPKQYYPGVTQGKIDGAYYFAYAEYLNTHTGKESRSDLYLHANQAGQAATIATVQSITGVKVDHFVEANLLGFYQLAAAFGGIEVCVKPAPAQGGFAKGANLTDYDPQTGTDNSGFSAYQDGYNRKKGGAQYLHLSAPQSLAFVRSRDTLPGVDIGRTHRQQATIDYVVWKLKSEGVLTSITQLDGLLGTANKYLITDNGWNLLDFATNMRALSGSNLSFQTLPVASQVNGMELNGSAQDVNIIDVPHIKQIVHAAFYPSPASKPAASGGAAQKKATALAPAKITVDVYNGSTVSTAPLAGQTSAALTALGYQAGVVANASAQDQPVEPGTQVFYGAGAAGNAAQLAARFGTSATPLKTLAADHVEVLIGTSVTAVPSAVPSGVTASGTAAGTATAGTQSIGARLLAVSAVTALSAGPGNGLSGAPVTVGPHAKYGIPCVY